MAALGSQSIASSYEQLLHTDADGGGNGTTLVSVKDGDNGTTFDIQLSSNSTNFQTDFQVGGTAVTSTAAELNYNDITTLGTSQASKVVTADGSGDILHGGSMSVGATKKLYLDGGTDTYLVEASDNVVDFFIGGNKFIKYQSGSEPYAQFSEIDNIFGNGISGAASFYGQPAITINNRSDTAALRSAVVFVDLAGDVNGKIECNAGANTTTYTTSSDYRLKENEKLINGALNRINSLKPYEYNFKKDITKTTYEGFFAHEVAPIIGQAISGDKDEVEFRENIVISKGRIIAYGVNPDDFAKAKENGQYPEDSELKDEYECPKWQQIDMSKMIPVLVAAVQELASKVESLEA